MTVFVIGNGAREHAIIWKIAQNKQVKKIYCASGNAGIAQIAECVNISADNIEELTKFAQQKNIDLVVVGPEVPLVAGIVDKFENIGIRVFGPNKKASQFEGSKVFSKDFMNKYQIPTARYANFTTVEDSIKGLTNFSYPLVIKADGLAAGKGVIICENKEHAETTLQEMMINKKFGQAGEKIVIEEYLEGIEASLLCFVTGKSIVPMESARDYKKAYDNDKGLNTGGMGSFSPNTIYTPEIEAEIKTTILDRTINGFIDEDIDFRGVLFIGLMITKEGVKVLEYNVRFGDPETQVVLPRLESDLVEIFNKTIDGTLTAEDLKWSNEKCCTVVAASGGYPAGYQKGKTIAGLNNVDKDIIVFHAGTMFSGGQIITNGGRVLNVTAKASTLEEAREKVYQNITKINFDGMFFRKDIAKLD